MAVRLKPVQESAEWRSFLLLTQRPQGAYMQRSSHRAYKRQPDRLLPDLEANADLAAQLEAC